MEHGIFEILQGNTRPTSAPLGLQMDALGFGYVIDAIGPAHEFWPGASEPAFTLIPNFLITGILALITGLIVIIWSILFIERKFGARIFFSLCIMLFLVGGGSPPVTNGIIASLLATRINKPLNWWVSHLSEKVVRNLAYFWPLSIICVVILSLFGVELAIFGLPLIWFLNYDQMMIFLLAIGNFTTLFILATVITAFAYDIHSGLESQSNS